jgi:lipopolysaccharide transport system ATP-binding protein
VRLEITARVNKPVSEAVMGFMIKDRLGQIMYGINSYRLGQTIEQLSVGEQLVFCFQFAMNLGKGNYSITTAISKMDSHLADNYEWYDGGVIFSVLNTKKADFAGSVSLDAALSVQRVSVSPDVKQDDKN